MQLGLARRYHLLPKMLTSLSTQPMVPKTYVFYKDSID